MWNLTFKLLILSTIILWVLIKLFSKKIVGMAGEHWVKKELKKLSKDYLIINDVMLIVNNKSFQIDHLVISKYGIFVIETKQYNGYLIGNDYDKKWIFKSGKRIYYINNPIHQNYGHIECLKEVLNLDDESKFISIVCISSNAVVKVKSDKVVTICDLIEKINSYEDEVLQNYEEIYSKVLSLNITDKKKKNKHIKDIKKIIKQKEYESINKCPKCGGDLVQRNGLYGNFVGCSNYPKCKFTKK